MFTGGPTTHRKIRRRWSSARDHVARSASCAIAGRVDHNRRLHTGHNNGVLRCLDFVFRPSGQAKGKRVLNHETFPLFLSYIHSLSISLRDSRIGDEGSRAFERHWPIANGFVKCLRNIRLRNFRGGNYGSKFVDELSSRACVSRCSRRWFECSSSIRFHVFFRTASEIFVPRK